MTGKRNKRDTKSQTDWAEFYDSSGVLSEIADADVELSLADELREAIRSGKRKYKLDSSES